MIASTGSKLAPSYYVMAAGLVSTLALARMHDRTGKAIE
ncbi:proline/glycine betaine transporter, Major facilitator superfamily (fragment) [Ralstonia solanacearum K60]